jgi:flagellar FliL protein
MLQMNRKQRWIGIFLVAVITFAAGCGEEEEEIVEETVGILEMETFLTNINDSSGERYAKLQLKLAVAPEEMAAEVTEDALLMAKLRDQVLTLISSKTFEQLSDPQGKETLRTEIQERLSPLVEGGELKEVLFAEFVVQ